MKRFFLVVAAVATFGVATAQQNMTQTYIEVVGESRVEVEADSFTIAIEIDEGVISSRSSVSKVESMMTSTLRGLGIDTKEDLKVSDLSSVIGRRSDALQSVNYELKVGSAEMVSKVIDALDGLGIKRVNLVSYENTQIETHIAEARKRAVDDAKLKAQQLSDALGQGVGPCVQLIDNGGYYRGGAPQLMRANSMVAESIEFRMIEIPYQITARFYLEI
ncbi:MAG: SIMPL domain-containing protein [Rikenellaceae bacterium]